MRNFYRCFVLCENRWSQDVKFKVTMSKRKRKQAKMWMKYEQRQAIRQIADKRRKCLGLNISFHASIVWIIDHLAIQLVSGFQMAHSPTGQRTILPSSQLASRPTCPLSSNPSVEQFNRSTNLLADQMGAWPACETDQLAKWPSEKTAALPTGPWTNWPIRHFTNCQITNRPFGQLDK